MDGVLSLQKKLSTQNYEKSSIETDETYNHIINEIKNIKINDLLHNDKHSKLVENINKFNESVRRLSIPSSTMGFEKNIMYEYKKIHIDIGKAILETISNYNIDKNILFRTI